MISFHFIVFKMLSAYRANSILAAICSLLVFLLKSTQVQQSSCVWIGIPTEQKFINPFWLLYLK